MKNAHGARYAPELPGRRELSIELFVGAREQELAHVDAVEVRADPSLLA